MKNFLITLSLFLFCLRIDAVTLVQLRTRIDAWLVDKWPVIQAKQDSYFTQKSRYWQGLATHLDIPSQTTVQDNDIVPDAFSKHPTDQQESWLEAFPSIANLPFPCQLICNNYDGPRGKGYVIIIRALYNGTIYARSQNVGPEVERTSGWAIEDTSSP